MIRELTLDDHFELFELVNNIFEGKRNIFQIKNSFLNERNNCFGYFLNNKLIGFINFIYLFEEADLDLIGVEEKYRKMGIGKKLVEKMFISLRVKNVKRIFLEVYEKNYNAIKLYENNGFFKINFRKDYYGLNKNAIVMKKVLE